MSICRADFSDEQAAAIEVAAKRYRTTFASAVRVLMQKALEVENASKAVVKQSDNGSETVVKQEQNASSPSRARGEDSSESSMVSPEKEETTKTRARKSPKKPRPRDEYIDQVDLLCDGLGVPRIDAGLLHQWRKLYCEGEPWWVLRILKDLGASGKLDKPVAYLKTAIERNAKEGKFKHAERPPLYDSEEERLAWEAGERLRAAGFTAESLSASLLSDDDLLLFPEKPS